jgi:pre-mRNA-splicing helicase BRR2
VAHEVVEADSLNADDRIVVKVTLDRDADEDEADAAPGDYTVVAPLYPQSKQESWWVVIGEPSTRTLLAIKKVPLQRKHVVSLDFNLREGKHDLTLSVVSDSYVGCDREYPVSVAVAAGEGSDEDDDEDDEDEKMDES